jgi:hypothetical protein
MTRKIEKNNISSGFSVRSVKNLIISSLILAHSTLPTSSEEMMSLDLSKSCELH